MRESVEQVRKTFNFSFFNTTQTEEVTQEQVQLEQSPQSLDKAIAIEQNLEIKKILHAHRELNKMAKITATMVDEQGDMVETIRKNISNTLEDVQDGSLDTQKANVSRQSTCNLF